MFQIFQEGKYYYFRLIAANGQTLMTSEAYTSKRGAKFGILAAKKWAAKAKYNDDNILPAKRKRRKD